jgi:uncharacterized membrane protein YbhN (UPF0104 family)
MTGKTSSLVDRLAIAMTIAIFCAAIVVLFREFATVSPLEVLASLAGLPSRQIFAAVALMAASYLLLTGYDFLALRYVNHRLRFRDVLFASFTAFAFSNSIGFQLFSGGSMRYRIYSGLGLDVVKISEIIAFCTFTYALGVVTVGSFVALLNPIDVAALLHLPEPLISAVGAALLAFSLGYLAVVAIWRKPIAFRGYRLRPPSFTLAVSQVALASIDAVLAGTVMYVLLPPDIGLAFHSYLAVYLAAATASVLSLVPGGVGVFETVMTVVTAPPSKAAALSAFLAYRMIYFVAPLALAIVWMAVRELRRRSIG